MFMSGVSISGIAIMRVRQLMVLPGLQARNKTGSCAAVLGTTTLGSAVLRTATGFPRAFATASSVFGCVVPWRGLHSSLRFIPLALCFLFKLIETIVIYKLPEASREEIAQMLGITDLKQTRFYQEAFLEGQEAEQRKLIRRLRDRNYSPEDIAQLLDVSVEEVQRLLT
jgi:uncharacterized protein YjeT (DUF2065 family)